MAERKENFEHFDLELTTTSQVAYTCPVGKECIVFTIHAANIDGTYEADIFLARTKAAEGGAAVKLSHAMVIPPGSALNCIAGKKVLKAGDTVIAEASADNAIEISGSVLEVDA